MNLKIFKNLFVGISQSRNDHTLGNLGFMVPHEKNSAGRKREKSVYQWLQECDSRTPPAKLKAEVLPNIPRTGFRTCGSAYRHVTSAAYARVFDPYGFELEISVDNLIDILSQTDVHKGEIQDKLVWARDGANNFLLIHDSKEEQKAWHEGEKLKPEPGDIVVSSQTNNRFLYLGVGFRQWVGLCGDEIIQKTGYWYNSDEAVIPEPSFVSTFDDPRKGHIYIPVLAQNYNYRYATFNPIINRYEMEFRRSPMKITRILGSVELSNNVFDPQNTYITGIMYHNCQGDFHSKMEHQYRYFDAEKLEFEGHAHSTSYARIKPDTKWTDDDPEISVYTAQANIEALRKIKSYRIDREQCPVDWRKMVHDHLTEVSEVNFSDDLIDAIMEF